MREAILFRENEEPIRVTAEEVRDGFYDRHEEFVDPDHEFKVQFVKGARNNGGPYFRLYYSYEEYKKLYPDRATRYEIVANMRRFEESEWHRQWKDRCAHFCSIEKCIKDESTKQRKFADAYYEKTRTCIEFQYSYISFDFEERNKFYSNMSINTVWLYALPSANACENEEGNIEILEDNARGFFRISENPNNLRNHSVYIQVKSGTIYRVKKLFRRPSSTDKKSTIRYFVPTEVYTESEFVDAIKSDTLCKSYNNLEFKRHVSEDRSKNEVVPCLLKQLWSRKYSSMRVKNVENGKEIYINCDGHGGMFRDYKTGCIKYKYADNKYGYYAAKDKYEYPLSHDEENGCVWIVVDFKLKSIPKKQQK